MRKYHLTAAMALASLANIPHSLAGGLWLNEFGDFAGGRASAGAAAGVDEPSTLLHNPASVTRLKGSQLQVTGAALLPSLKFDQTSDPAGGPGGGDGGDAGVLSPAGGLFYVHDTQSDRWGAGMYFSGLAGIGLDYDKDWVGRYQAIDSSLLIATFAPTAAYRVTDRLSLGASMQWYFASLDTGLRIPNPLPGREDGTARLDGTDSEVAYTLGLLYQFSDSTRLGIKYQSEMSPDFDGNLSLKKLPVEVDTNTSLTMAQFVRVGLYHQFTDKLALDLTLGWDDWSAMDEVFVSVANTGAGLDRNARDTQQVAVGMEYVVTERWTMTAGVSYDTNPMDADYRTADMPLDRQIHVGLGSQYMYSDELSLSGYLNYADLGEARITTPTWQGKYDTSVIYQVGVSARWHF
ncbi:OmpP1/FadL family transporter [Haliea sp. E17]|uniref:OmpP1/FadL family transporter n=1 Tax=Haliea sp. E17 TaxID=3401576 RepID=UPI003AAEB739